MRHVEQRLRETCETRNAASFCVCLVVWRDVPRLQFRRDAIVTRLQFQSFGRPLTAATSATLFAKMPVTLPGDVLSLPSTSSSSTHSAASSSAIKLGPGLLWPSEAVKNEPNGAVRRPVLATKAGLIGAINSSAGRDGAASEKKGKQGWWIESVGGSVSASPAHHDNSVCLLVY